MLKFIKLYKFIVKIVIFPYRSDTIKNDQIKEQFILLILLLCGHFQFSCLLFGHIFYPMTKLVVYLSHFQLDHLKFLNFGHLPLEKPVVTKLVIYLCHFQLDHLKFLNFGHLSLEKTTVSNFFGHLVTYLSFCTSVCI